MGEISPEGDGNFYDSGCWEGFTLCTLSQLWGMERNGKIRGRATGFFLQRLTKFSSFFSQELKSQLSITRAQRERRISLFLLTEGLFFT